MSDAEIKIRFHNLLAEAANAFDAGNYTRAEILTSEAYILASTERKIRGLKS